MRRLFGALARRDLGWAITAGIVLALSAVPWPLPVLAFAVGPLLLHAMTLPQSLTDSTQENAPPALRAFWLGAAAGFVCNAIALFWVVDLLRAFARFPLVAALPVGALLWAGQALPFAIAMGATAALTRRGLARWWVLPATMAIAFSVTWTLFPWRPASPLVRLPWLVQHAELGGPPLVDFAMLLASCALFDGVRTGARRVAAAGAVVALATAGYGLVRLPMVEAAREAAPVLAVGVVQPNVSIEDKQRPSLAPLHLAQLRRATAVLEADGAALVVWPESAYPYPMPRTRRRDLPGYRRIHGQGVAGPVLFGTITTAGGCDRWNSVIAMDDAGAFRGTADKVRLLHFGETVPFWHVLPPLQRMFRCPGLRAGERPEVLSLAGRRVGVLNCYEDVLASLTRTVAAQDPDWLVNVTNDAWFGDSFEPHLHHMVARMRAIETRRDLVRAVNTGVSGHIAATGEEQVRTDTWVSARFVAEVRPQTGRTPWVRFGDLTTPALFGALFGAALARRRG